MASGMEAHKLITRADSIERMLAVGAGVVSGAIIADGFASDATPAPVARGDAAVLNFALAFEQLQADFYARTLAAGKVKGEWLQFAQVVGAHEREHVTFLRNKLGAAAHPAPVFELTPAALDQSQFPHIAITLEDAGVALYNGQATNLSKPALAAAAEIVSVEARHASWARDLAGITPAPNATDPAATVPHVQAQLAGIGVKVRG